VSDYDDDLADDDVVYRLAKYAGVRATILSFLGDEPVATLEVGCSRGHWLEIVEDRLKLVSEDRGSPSEAGRPTTPAERYRLVGVDSSLLMLTYARRAVQQARLVCARADNLPWRDAMFDRIYCVNVLHHLDRDRFFAEARRVLRPGGGLLTIGRDPEKGRDSLWMYEYFEETRAIDRARYQPMRVLRGEMARAGFSWADSHEADHINLADPTLIRLRRGRCVSRANAMSLGLSDDAFERGRRRMKEAGAAADRYLQSVSEFKLYATVGWLA